MPKTINDIENIINQLIGLQEITSKIYNLEKRKKDIPTQFQADQKELFIVKKKYETTKAENDKYQKQIEERNKTIKKLREEIKGIQEKEKRVKTQKEFLALDSEVTYRKDKILELEKENKKDEKKIKEITKKLNEQKESAEEAIEYINEMESDLNKDIKEIDDELDILYKEKEDYVENMDEDLVETFDRISQNKKGLAIVPVVDNICEGCHISIHAQHLNEIRKKEKIIYCRNCARILYLP